MALKTFISKYKYCAIGILIAMNCSAVTVFKLNGLAFGLVVLAFCCTLQFLINDEEPDKSTEKELDAISERLFHRVMNIVPEIVYVSMFDGSVKYISDGIEKLIGYKPDEIYKTRNLLLHLVHPDDKEKVSKQIQNLQNGSEATIEYRLLKKDRTYVWVSDYLNTIKNEWGNVTHYNGILVNFDERKITDKNLQSLNARIHQLNDMVNHHAVRDSLTNIYNRRYSLVILQNEFNRARAQNKALSCLLMDIDHLEPINNRYGYFIGDRIITEVSKCLQKHIRSSDVVSRFGEDEFLIILPEIDSGELDRISGLLVNAVENCLVKDEEKNLNIDFRVTVGTSSVTTLTKNITDLIEQAGKALYAAKVSKKARSKGRPVAELKR
ncbi:MAG: diguanylate cyclase [Candidatus Brocadia sp. AMX2]|uniref:diguanylate cyclase n=1 Tax=Candidatus Brocadia sinica JPN1 TaxID=1197129 RepID=A0ABQ0JVM0_9BACT|nr:MULTISPECIES: sensor domain-containing diguanylate cyclase [Brocadia]KXK30182.1 MAG: putative diguanylate cyclase [Candidatus Brocadia sinica]MBC6930748.1 diguanylate cyclase [Candidatus Brocadia sp.]MBL1167716.1 diguanylate cyclase [Candidatus Brocadia sp. AMX1]NOG41329.1 diguanylate cyclase [Planctomycetota bacterium]KAA0245611.1 MAG: diguanylate cyclase [Candidatus Brocadia sp. AMX2]